MEIDAKFFLIQDGHAKCQRLQCRPLNCRYKIYDEDNCCPRCAANRAEVRILSFVISRREQLSLFSIFVSWRKRKPKDCYESSSWKRFGECGGWRSSESKKAIMTPTSQMSSKWNELNAPSTQNSFLTQWADTQFTRMNFQFEIVRERENEK